MSGREQRKRYIDIVNDGSVFCAFVVALKDSLNLHLQIDWNEDYKELYESALNYSYKYISEESDGPRLGQVNSCHLKGLKMDSLSNMKRAYIIISKISSENNGWVKVRLYDIDVYGRILIELLDPMSEESINERLMREGIATSYKTSRPGFIPNKSHIKYNVMWR